MFIPFFLKKPGRPPEIRRRDRQAPWLFVLDDPGFDAAVADHPFGKYEIVPARSVLSISWKRLSLPPWRADTKGA